MPSRQDIVSLAHWWAAPGEYKPTAEELVSFFTDAGAEQAPTLSNAQAALTAGGTGVKVGSQTKHWCGIFACSVLRSLGVDCKWTLLGGTIKGSGVTSPAIGHTPRTGNELRPGDIAIIRRAQHHFIITDVDYANNQVYVVEGNTTGQIIRWAVRYINYTGSKSAESIYAFYRFKG